MWIDADHHRDEFAEDPRRLALPAADVYPSLRVPRNLLNQVAEGVQIRVPSPPGHQKDADERGKTGCIDGSSQIEAAGGGPLMLRRLGRVRGLEIRCQLVPWVVALRFMSDATPEPYRLPDARVASAWRRLIDDYLVCDPLEPAFADRILRIGATTFAELGSASGPISQLLSRGGVECVALDLNPPDEHVQPMVRADLLALPLRRRSFDVVSAVNCLYFLADPVAAIRAASELLRTGGTFLASAPSRFHDPELAEVLERWGEASSFDAENAEDLVGQVFTELDVRWWELPAFHLEDRRAVVDYLVAFKQPRPEEKAERIRTPVTVTKSGCDVWATVPVVEATMRNDFEGGDR